MKGSLKMGEGMEEVPVGGKMTATTKANSKMDIGVDGASLIKAMANVNMKGIGKMESLMAKASIIGMTTKDIKVHLNRINMMDKVLCIRKSQL